MLLCYFEDYQGSLPVDINHSTLSDLCLGSGSITSEGNGVWIKPLQSVFFKVSDSKDSALKHPEINH